ncbi:RidA family protein [Olivibacter sp. SDN3]|nr:RidA family protein [Olivibacter sp. SDN3]
MITFENPVTVAAPNGYSHVVKVDLGNAYMLVLSGQVAFDEKGVLIGKDNFAKQTEQVFQNIKNIIETAGGTMDNLVKLGFFVTDISQLQQLRSVRDTFINTEQPPASTLVEVKGLVHKDLLIEIEATAIVPKG